MKVAGIREARQNLTSLLEEVRKGREVVITDRGKPVARLVPPRRQSLPFPDLSEFRRQIPAMPSSTPMLEEDRNDRF